MGAPEEKRRTSGFECQLSQLACFAPRIEPLAVGACLWISTSPMLCSWLRGWNLLSPQTGSRCCGSGLGHICRCNLTGDASGKASFWMAVEQTRCHSPKSQINLCGVFLLFPLFFRVSAEPPGLQRALQPLSLGYADPWLPPDFGAPAFLGSGGPLVKGGEFKKSGRKCFPKRAAQTS